MESFKEFVLEESAKNNYKIADFLKSQNKTADSITNDDIEEYYKINKINYTSLPKLDTIKKIMNGKSNSQASKELKNSSDGEFTKLAKEGKIQQFINKIKKYTDSENSELKVAANNALSIASKLNAASVVAEAVDDNEELVKAAEKVDAIIQSLGDKYKDGTPGERSAIENELAQYINKLASDTKNISNENGGEILKTLMNAADKNKDKKLTSLEVRDYVSTNNNIKDGTNLKFILALLWFKTQNVEMYKKALLTDSGSAKANGISEAVLKQYNKLVTGVTNLSLGEDIMKLIGGNISGFSDIEEFSAKLAAAAKELSKPLSENERNKLRANNSDVNTNDVSSTPSSNIDNKTPDNTEDEALDNTSEVPDTSSERAEDNSSSELSKANKEGKQGINSLNVNSTSEEIEQAVNNAFGEVNATDPSKMGVIYNNIIKQANETKESMQEFDKNSRTEADKATKTLDNIRDIKSNYGAVNKMKSAARKAIIDDRDTVAENIVLDTLNNNKLLKEVALARKIKNNLPTVGRRDLSTDGSWDHFFDEFPKIRQAYSKKAHTFATNMSGIMATTKKAETIVKLKNLYNDYFDTMMKTFYKAKASNNYSAKGLAEYNKRGAKVQKAQNEQEKFDNSKFGKSYNLTKQNIEGRVKSLTVGDLDNIFEDLKPVFAYAIVNYHRNKAILDGIDVTDKVGSKNKVIDSFLNAVVKHHDKFGVATPNEARLFIDTFVEQKIKEPEIEEWLHKYDGIYKSKQQQQPIINALLALNKSKVILKKLQSCNAYKSIKSIFDGSSNSDSNDEELRKGAADAAAEASSESKAQVSSVRTESLTFKEYYMLNEGLFNKNNNNQQQVVNFSDDEKKAIAALCVFSKNEFENTAAEYLSKVSGRNQQLTSDEIKKAAEAYKNKNADAIQKYSNSFESIVNTSKQNQGQQTTTTATNGATEQQATGQQGQQTTTTATNGATEQQATGQQGQQTTTTATNGAAGQQQPTPPTGGSSFDSDTYEQEMAYREDPNKVTNTSVVTSGAVGGYTIPDRLYKQLIRRRIK